MTQINEERAYGRPDGRLSGKYFNVLAKDIENIQLPQTTAIILKLVGNRKLNYNFKWVFRVSENRKK